MSTVTEEIIAVAAAPQDPPKEQEGLDDKQIDTKEETTETDESKEESDGLDDDDNEEITLITAEGKKFQIKKSIAMCSELIKTTVTKSVDEAVELTLSKEVHNEDLEKIISYITHHHNNAGKEIKQPLKSAKIGELVDEWDAEFLKMSDEEVFSLMIAANYLSVDPLVKLLAAYVAFHIKGKTPEQIRERFNIENDLTEEEVAQIKEDTKWVTE